MDRFRQDVRYALRALVHRPGFTLAALLTIALGIGATTDRNGLDVLSISLRTGRLFEATDRHGSLPVPLVNQAAAQQFWPGENPVGKRINVGVRFGYDHDEWTIVGVSATSVRCRCWRRPKPQTPLPSA